MHRGRVGSAAPGVGARWRLRRLAPPLPDNDPLTHAASWLRPLGETDLPAYEAAIDRWTTHLHDLRIEAVGYGAVVLRRRASGEAWIKEDHLPLDRLEPAGDHTLRVFAAQDLLERIEDAELLDARLHLVSSHRLVQHLEAADGTFAVHAQTLELTDGLCFTIESIGTPRRYSHISTAGRSARRCRTPPARSSSRRTSALRTSSPRFRSFGACSRSASWWKSTPRPVGRDVPAGLDGWGQGAVGLLARYSRSMRAKLNDTCSIGNAAGFRPRSGTTRRGRP